MMMHSQAISSQLNILEDSPNEILLEILLGVSTQDLLELRKVCKRLNIFIPNHPMLSFIPMEDFLLTTVDKDLQEFKEKLSLDFLGHHGSILHSLVLLGLTYANYCYPNFKLAALSILAGGFFGDKIAFMVNNNCKKAHSDTLVPPTIITEFRTLIKQYPLLIPNGIPNQVSQYTYKKLLKYIDDVLEIQKDIHKDIKRYLVSSNINSIPKDPELNALTSSNEKITNPYLRVVARDRFTIWTIAQNNLAEDSSASILFSNNNNNNNYNRS